MIAAAAPEGLDSQMAEADTSPGGVDKFVAEQGSAVTRNSREQKQQLEQGQGAEHVTREFRGRHQQLVVGKQTADEDGRMSEGPVFGWVADKSAIAESAGPRGV